VLGGFVGHAARAGFYSLDGPKPSDLVNDTQRLSLLSHVLYDDKHLLSKLLSECMHAMWLHSQTYETWPITLC